MLKNKKILIGITGSIAAYKIVFLVRLLIKEGAEVKIIMTSAATDFVSPLTLSTLSKNEVLQDLSTENNWANHVAIGRWADVYLIAPLSCNSLAKMANGLCDNLLLAVYLSATCPVVVAPAMDEDMWLHPSCKNNIETIKAYGNFVLPVYKGELASGLTGAGRMAEPEEMIKWLQNFFGINQDLLNKKILISAGPTYEAIDPVRFIGNRSSGKMGIALAETCLRRGAEVTLVLGPVKEKIPQNLHVIKVTSAAEMYDACVNSFSFVDVAIMCAAVADYTIAEPSNQKIKKNNGNLELSLVKTKDILKELGNRKTEAQIVVGFALETNNAEDNALKKLKEKNADFIVLNSLQDDGAGFEQDSNKITIFDKTGRKKTFPLKTKSAVAEDILNTIIDNNHA